MQYRTLSRWNAPAWGASQWKRTSLFVSSLSGVSSSASIGSNLARYCMEPRNRLTIQYNTNLYCQLPMGAFQRQILIAQAIKKTNKQTKNTQELSINNY